MAILSLLVRRRASCRVRLMAFANVLACCFVVAMTLVTTSLAWFVLIPRLYSDGALWLHQCAVCYIFLNVSGNFYLCATTDTSAERLLLDSSDKTGQTSGTCGERQLYKGKETGRTDAEHREALSRSSATRSEESELSGTGSLDNDEVPSKRSLGRRKKSGVSKSVEIGSWSACGARKGMVATNTSTVRPRRPIQTSASVLDPNLDQSQRGGNCRKASVAHPASLPADNGLSDSKCLPEHDVSVKRSAAEPGTMPEPKPAEGREPRQSSDDFQRKLAPRGVDLETVGHGVERSHFCKLCEKTILKRDHHCFFMTTCVGYFNQKHFIFFCFYMMLGAFYGLVLVARFLHVRYDVDFHGPQTFFLLLKDVAVTILQEGRAPPLAFCLVLYELYVCLGVTLMVGGFLFWQLSITAAGQTTYEMITGDKTYSTATLGGNLRDVFGRYWPVLFLLPLPLPQVGNGRYSSARQGAERSTCPRQEKDEFANPGRQVPEKRKRNKCRKAVRKILPRSEQSQRLVQPARKTASRRK